MGSGASVNTDINDMTKQQEAVRKNKAINRFLNHDRIMEAKTVKLLLLGAAESGKSTFAKQMRIIHQDGFSVDEKLSYRHLVWSNVIYSMHEVLCAMDRMAIKFSSPDREGDRRTVIMYRELLEKSDILLDQDLWSAIKRLWQDHGVHRCLSRFLEFQLNDSAEYFFNEVDRISARNYVPSDQDILRIRQKTSGVIETKFHFKGYTFRMFDVGGQRSERRKWIHVFDNVTAIIFTAALSGYDQVLQEDKKTNRMQESLNLFSSICRHECFIKTSIILLLNKNDIFQRKLAYSSLTTCFPDFQGPNTFERAAAYIRTRFESAERYKKEIYTHFTVATDTRNINFVFDASMAVVLKHNLEDAGMF